jgi:hypothetical protein
MDKQFVDIFQASPVMGRKRAWARLSEKNAGKEDIGTKPFFNLLTLLGSNICLEWYLRHILMLFNILSRMLQKCQTCQKLCWAGLHWRFRNLD